MIEIVAIAASILLGGLAVFQIALMLGAPIGRFAWGGYHTVLPTRLRIASGISVVLYVVFSIFILAKAELITVPMPNDAITIGMWVLTGYFSLGIPTNAISRSKSERIVMTPIVTLLAVLFLFVAMK